MSTPLDESIERVSAYVAVRSRAQGLDPEVLHGFNDLDLTMSDLRRILLAARALAAVAKP